MREEIFVLAPRCFDRYLISSRKKIVSLATGRRMGFFTTQSGYLAFSVNDGIKNHSRMFHRIYYEAFCGKIPFGLTINHKDGNKTNNDLGNLEAMTLMENIEHSWKLRLGCVPKPVSLINTKTGEKRNYRSRRFAAKELNITEKDIFLISIGERRTAKGWKIDLTPAPAAGKGELG